MEVSPNQELVLYTLANKELCGVQISRAIEDCSDGKKIVRVSSLYVTLQEMEEKGVLSSYLEEKVPDFTTGGKRRFYRLTDMGKNLLQSRIDFRRKLSNWNPK